MGESKIQLSQYGPYLFNQSLTKASKIYHVLAYRRPYSGGRKRETMEFFVECTDGSAHWYTRANFDELALKTPEGVTFDKTYDKNSDGSRNLLYGMLFAKDVRFNIDIPNKPPVQVRVTDSRPRQDGSKHWDHTYEFEGNVDDVKEAYRPDKGYKFHNMEIDGDYYSIPFDKIHILPVGELKRVSDAVETYSENTIFTTRRETLLLQSIFSELYPGGVPENGLKMIKDARRLMVLQQWSKMFDDIVNDFPAAVAALTPTSGTRLRLLF